MFETGARDDLEFEWTNAFGRTMYLHYALVPERDEYGHVAHVLAVGHDLTEGQAGRGGPACLAREAHDSC